VRPVIVSAAEIRAAVGFVDLIEPVAEAFRATSAGHAENDQMQVFPGPTREAGDVLIKSGALRGHSVYIVKIAPWFALNVHNGCEQGGVLAVFDVRTGHTRAILDDQHYLSDIRTAAAGSVAARILAPTHVDTALVIGAGTQAYWQPQALHRERPLRRLLIWARDPDRGAALATRLAPVLPGVETEVVQDLEPATRRADVVLTATQARQPLIRGDWLHPGQHITAVGADDASKCELDAAVLRRARVFVDERSTALATGDVYRATQDSGYRPDELAGELGHVLAGTTPGRTDPEDITVATLSGIGAQDVVAAEIALRRLGVEGIHSDGSS
jgi:ornithine cyclodeaminase/alanine dehydrogenase-like protein (mu-crystallin family)